ncbi:MAG TPA: DegT/DnrJ/EryC1/StrS family aminotransferase [Gemmatimonadales bacterium]
MSVPLLDLKAQFAAIRDEVMPAVLGVIESQAFIMGEAVGRLEQGVARVVGVPHAIACASGTDALLLPLKALDLKPGDEVITTPFTFFATAGTIHNAGGKPVFVDIDPVTFNLDVGQVEAAITPRTRAVIPVHLFGQMAAMDALLPLAERHGVAVIEDCAQAIGARRKMGGTWRQAGSLGSVNAFSFFPSKNLGAWGDGGLMTTADEKMANRLRRLRTHGGLKMYHHDEVGTNSRLDTLQAAVLLAKLPHLPAWAEGRRKRAAVYDRELAGVRGVVTPPTDPPNEHVYHQYTIRADRRDGLRERLQAKGIGCAVYYPVALHQQPCFAHLGYATGRFPESERATAEVLSIPVYPELSDAQQGTVIAAIREFYA